MKIKILNYLDKNKSKIIFYIITLLFGVSIVSISFSSLFQVFFILIFLVDLLIYIYFYKKNKQFKYENRIKDKTNNKNKLEFKIEIFKNAEFYLIFLFFLSFILSYIFSINYKLSLYRLPIYLSIFFLLISSFYIFSNYFNDLINLEKKDYFYSILIIFIFYLINFLYLILTYKNFNAIFADRRSGFLRNAVGYAYCTIIPIYYVIFNFYLFIKKSKIDCKINIFAFILLILILFFAFFSFLSSGTRSAIFSFFISILFFLLLIFIIISKSRFIKIFSILVLVLLFIFSALIIEPLFYKEGNYISQKINSIRSFIIKNIFKDKWTFERLINSGYEIKQIFSWINHPEITSREDLRYFESAERAALLSASIKIINKRFFTGTGPFAWHYYINNNDDINIYFYNHNVNHSHCHNDFLQIFSEFGFFSFALFLLIILLSFIKIIRNLIKDKDNRFLYVLFLSILIFFLGGGLTDYLFGHPLVGPFYSLFIGLFLKKENNI